MSILALSRDIDLVLVKGPTHATAALVRNGVTLSQTSERLEVVRVLASGVPCLALGATHFPMSAGQLRWAADVLGMPIAGGAS